MRDNHSDSNPAIEFAQLLVAVALILAGIYMAVFGVSWASRVFAFLPMVLIVVGVALFAFRRRTRKT